MGAEYLYRRDSGGVLKKKARSIAMMIEAVVENDDEALMAKYIEGEEIDRRELKAAASARVIAMKLFPVICGTAFKNKGVQPLLDAVVDYLPSPLDIPPVKGKNPDTGEEEIRKPTTRSPSRRWHSRS
jgi:elongation factor G